MSPSELDDSTPLLVPFIQIPTIQKDKLSNVVYIQPGERADILAP
jgi:hypothetical protein